MTNLQNDVEVDPSQLDWGHQTGAILTGAPLTGAPLTGASLTGAQDTGAMSMAGSISTKPRASFEQPDISAVDFRTIENSLDSSLLDFGTFDSSFFCFSTFDPSLLSFSTADLNGLDFGKPHFFGQVAFRSSGLNLSSHSSQFDPKIIEPPLSLQQWDAHQLEWPSSSNLSISDGSNSGIR
ncbi:hypothetical protein Slin15195_G130310 [Septoria linicola]|uniref:Uncharacterized protein n=1 Tax=Septoria linicola TaxID=215465 RepID=A0A9Q9B9E6_9PEZI|nr:hypothetical protein Slin15195_G130310 [Septoria linicola]